MSRSIIVTIGREINGPYDGVRVGKSRGVWMLHEEDWQAFRESVMHQLTQLGEVLFAGKGRGFNPYDPDSVEESACYIACLRDTDDTYLRDMLAILGKRYGQRAIGYTYGEYSPIEC